jgi:hypothetical protein
MGLAFLRRLSLERLENPGYAAMAATLRVVYIDVSRFPVLRRLAGEFRDAISLFGIEPGCRPSPHIGGGVRGV